MLPRSSLMLFRFLPLPRLSLARTDDGLSATKSSRQLLLFGLPRPRFSATFSGVAEKASVSADSTSFWLVATISWLEILSATLETLGGSARGDFSILPRKSGGSATLSTARPSKNPSRRPRAFLALGVTRSWRKTVATCGHPFPAYPSLCGLPRLPALSPHPPHRTDLPVSG